MAKEEKNTLSNIASAASMAKGAIKTLPILQKELLRDRMELLLPGCGKAGI